MEEANTEIENPELEISKMLDECNATPDVRALAPLMGKQMLWQLAFPTAVFEGGKPTGFTNITPGSIQPSPVSDRVMLVIPTGVIVFVKATDIQASYATVNQPGSQIVRPPSGPRIIVPGR